MGTESKRIGLFGAVSATVGLIIGSAIFVLLPEITGMSGGSVWLVYLLSGVPTFFAAFYLIQMGGALPVSGAHYVGITQWVNPVFAYLTTFGGIMCILNVTPLVAMGFGDYVAALAPGMDPRVLGIALIALFCLINLFGVRLFNTIQIAMFVLLILSMLVFMFTGIPAGSAATRLPFMPNGSGAFIIAIAIASNSWLGIVGVTEIAGIVKNPKRNIPLALVISVVIITILYAGMAFAFSGVMGWEEAAKTGSSAVLVAAGKFLPGPLVGFIALGAMLAMATSINAFIMLTINVISPMAANGILPAGTMKTNRFGAPWRFILVFFVLAAGLILIFGASLASYAIMSMVGLMFMQFGGAVAVLRMPAKSPGLFRNAVFRFPVAVRWIIFILCMVAFWGLIGFGFLADWKVSTAFFVLTLCSLIYWAARSAWLKSKCQNLDDMVRQGNSRLILEQLGIDPANGGKA